MASDCISFYKMCNRFPATCGAVLTRRGHDVTGHDKKRACRSGAVWLAWHGITISTPIIKSGHVTGFGGVDVIPSGAVAGESCH
jgi:hypothetical protein